MSRGVSIDEAKKAKAKAPRIFAPLVGEIAVGIMKVGDEQFGLKVNLSESPDKKITLPSEIDGVPVQVEVVGKIRKR